MCTQTSRFFLGSPHANCRLIRQRFAHFAGAQSAGIPFVPAAYGGYRDNKSMFLPPEGLAMKQVVKKLGNLCEIWLEI